MQTLRAGCSKAVPKIFAPPQTPLPGARDRQNLTSWRWSLPSSTDPVWWRSMYAISSYRGNRPTHTHKQRPPVAGRTDNNTLHAPLSLARSVISIRGCLYCSTTTTVTVMLIAIRCLWKYSNVKFHNETQTNAISLTLLEWGPGDPLVIR